MSVKELRNQHREKKEEIKTRIKEFRELRDASDHRWFLELVFAILTSRTGAENAWEAAEELDENGLILDGGQDEIAEVLARNGVKYGEEKARYIVENREKLSQPTLSEASGDLKLKSRVDTDNPEKAREWLVEELSGVGWKAASHFLRNVGYGSNLAIVSGHIVKKLHDIGVVDSMEPPQDRQDYLAIEEKVRELSRSSGIPMEELDLVLWSLETGEVFK